MIILGINAYHGDTSAAVVVDGKLIAAAEEERFNRIKHTAGFPSNAVRYCIKEAGVSIDKIDYIAIPRDPAVRLIRKLYYGLKVPRLALRRLTALRKTKNIKKTIAQTFQVDVNKIGAKIVDIEHHRAHIASSFFVSGFDRSMVFSADGMGDFASTMWGIGEGNKIKVLGEVCFPHSLGLYYTAITQYLGFLAYGDEYKVMGLAAYGERTYKDEFKKILIKDRRLKFKLGLDYFVHHKRLVDMNFEEGYPNTDILFSKYLEKRLGKARKEGDSINERHKDIAATLQDRLEEVIISLMNELRSFCGLNELCLAGGVALNCVGNSKILERTPFKNIYIQPAAGDAGLAIGAIYYVWHQVLGKPRDFMMEHAYWGPRFNDDETYKAISAKHAELEKINYVIEKIDNEDELCRKAAQSIAQGKILGWFQGRMEWGPRALGNRSILVDPRRQDMQNTLNARIKHRESFRPFAPSILEEYAPDYFCKYIPSPFMLFSLPVKREHVSDIKAAAHIDDTARLQTVSKKNNPLYWQLIDEFRKITGVPALLNTSFNENEPIVCTGLDAIDCFLRTKMDILAVGNYWIEKNDQMG